MRASHSGRPHGVRQLTRHLPGATNLVIGTLGTLLVGVLTNALDDNPAKRALGGYYLPLVCGATVVLVFVAPPLIGRWRERHAARKAARSSYTPVADFFGRGDEIAQLLDALRPREEGAVVVLIWGMSDVGKTQLARFVMCHAEVAEAYPDGALQLDLHGIDPESHPREIGNAVREVLSKLPGLDAARYRDSDLTDLIDIYRTELRGRRLLLLLDNLDEHISKWKDLIYEEAAGCAFLVTSQAELRLPARSLALKLEPFTKKEATRFLAHVAHSGPGRPLEVPDDLAGEICRLCGYLPLTIRLAVEAMRDPERPQAPADFLRELSLEAGRALSRDSGELETKAAIAISYRLLPAEAQRVLRQLNLFQSPFEAADEEAVAQDPQNEHLRKLERRSLVLLNEHTGRYRLHKLVRDYTAPLLEPEECRRAAARYAWHARRRIHSVNRLRVGDQHEAITAQLKAALRACDDLRAGSGVELPALRAICHLQLCEVYRSKSRYREAITHGELAIELAAARRMRRAEMLAQMHMGMCKLPMGEQHDAMGHFYRSLALSRERGARDSEAESLGGLAAAHINIDEYDEAVDFFQQAISVAQAANLSDSYFYCIDGLAAVHNNRGEYEAAVELLGPALEAARKAEDKHYVTEFVAALGIAYLELGKNDLGIEYLQEAQSQSQGGPLSEADLLRVLGVAHDRRGNRDKAAYYLGRALAIARTFGSQHLSALTLEALGDAARRVNTLAAIRYYTHALRLGELIGRAQLVGKMHQNLGVIYAQEGSLPAALSHARSALETFQNIDSTNNPRRLRQLEKTQELISQIEEHAGWLNQASPAALLMQAAPDEDGFDAPPEPYRVREIREQIGNLGPMLDHFRDVGSGDGEADVELKLSLLYGELRDWQASLGHARRAAEVYERLEEAGLTQEARDNLTQARLQATLAEIELSPPGEGDDGDGE